MHQAKTKDIEMSKKLGGLNVFNRQIFQVLRTGGTSKSGILSKLCHMRCFWELVRCEKYFGSHPAPMGVGPHPKFQPTE